MTEKQKIRFFIFHFLNSGLAICAAAYLKIVSHEHAETVLAVALTYGLLTFGLFLRHRVFMRIREMK